MLAGAFKSLDDQEREIVFLRFVEDLDRKEVARRLGMSESALGRRSRAALGKLRHELEDDGVRRAAATGPEPAADPAKAQPGTPAAPPERSPERAQAKKAGGHSGRLLLRMPRSLHDDLADAAEREGVSLNRLITGTLTAAIEGRAPDDSREHEPGASGGPESRLLEAREVPRWLPAAIVANIVVVVLAAVVALVLLAIAWQNGW